jgi:hypothetical protein
MITSLANGSNLELFIVATLGEREKYRPNSAVAGRNPIRMGSPPPRSTP